MNETEQDAKEELRALRRELVTIFGIPPEKEGASWNERMLYKITQVLENK